MARDLDQTRAWRFVALLGTVSLCSDLIFAGARSLSGPFLGSLQAGPLVIGLVSGLGEFLGYAVRLVSGRLTDRWRRYGPITFTGYAVNLLAVPCLAWAGSWSCWEACPRPVLGVALWGLGRALLETVLKAAQVDLPSPERRATGYGIYAFVFGACWFGGSALMGFYTASP